MRTVRLAFFGIPGAGKTTATEIARRFAYAEGFDLVRIRLADPLYECQDAIYAIAGRPLTDYYDQDGVLLNFLGTHLRRINPTVLVDHFDKELDRLGDSITESRGRIIICDDMRSAEAEFLSARGFRLIRVTAPPELCLARRRARGDRSLGSSDHPTECGLGGVHASEEIPNAGSLDDLNNCVRALLWRLTA